jgi:hypothetical protein
MSKANFQGATTQVSEAVNHVNMGIADKREPVYTLVEMLSHKNVTTLRKFAKLCKVTGCSKMDKETIIPLLVERLTSPIMLSEHLLMLEPHEWELFCKAVKAKQITDDALLSANYRFVLELGIMFLYSFEGHFHYVVPTEVQDAYLTLEKMGFPADKEHADLLNSYAVAAANLYGFITLDELADLFNSQNERKTDAKEISGILIRYIAMDSGYCFWDEYIVHDIFEEDNFSEVKKIAEVAVGKPHYMPEKEDLLKYSKWDYMEETPQLQKIRGYVSRILHGNTYSVEKIVKQIYALGNYRAGLHHYMTIFKENGVNLKSGQIREVVSLISAWRPYCRVWMNNGFTAKEMQAYEDSQPKTNDTVRVVKVGRNEPCPCGSGKKYKKCCGA